MLLVGCYAPSPLNRTLSAGSAGGGSGGAEGSATAGSTGSTQTPGTLTAGVWDDSLNFAHFKTWRDTQQSKLADFTPQEQDAAAATADERTATNALDLVLVVDTTGSMGDEITWLQTEFRTIAERVQTAHPGVPQRWALVHYRDEGDEYVVRHVDFTGQVAVFQDSLMPLVAAGGGDFPEAPEVALERAATLSWDASPTTAKLVFWVADAPPHDQEVARFSNAVRGLRAASVHVYPVASSGIDARTEYAMRATAQLTLGRYLFLTDDSGVGESHLEPSVPCYVVTKLGHALERVIASELAGTRVAVDPSQIIRSVGNPVEGECALESGTVSAF